MANSVIDKARQRVIEMFEENVRGKIPDISAYNTGHDGKVGNWLEEQMGVTPNAANKPDLHGIELKTSTKSVLSLGSWDPNYWIFRVEKYRMTRYDFMEIFGKYNPKKKLYSWSGSPVPKIGGPNEFGVRIDIDSNSNISFIYSYTDDKRSNKSSIVPKNLQTEDLTIVRWDADYDESRTNTNTKKGLRLKVEEKYNRNGLCKCYREILENGKLGAYSSIGFMDPMTFETFMGNFKTGDFYFDCGMHQSEKGNTRNYCQWRVRNRFLDSLIVSRHP